MPYYFTVTDFLKVFKSGADRKPLTAPVTTYSDAEQIQQTVPEEDGIFVSEEYFNIWDTSQSGNAQSRLEQFISTTQIYRLSLELLMDRALLESRKGNRLLQKAIEYSCEKSNTAMPHDILQDAEIEVMAGNLAHPMLEHLQHSELAEFYFLFFEQLQDRETAREYSFDRLIALDRGPFYKHYDGFRMHGTDYLRFDKLLEKAKRITPMAGSYLDDFVSAGQKEAEQKSFDSAEQYLAAWLEADRLQARRCRDIHPLLALADPMPDCLKYDVFFIMQQEAKKQIFAEKITQEEDKLSALDITEHLKSALSHNAAQKICPHLEKLVAETLSPDISYAGSAEQFALQAEKRHMEAENMRLSVKQCQR